MKNKFSRSTPAQHKEKWAELGRLIGASFRRLFSSQNLPLKITAIVSAVLLWCVVLTTTNPVRTKILFDVPVQITGVAELNDRGLTIREDPEDLVDTVDITIQVNMNDMKSVTEENVQAVLDVSRIYMKGSQSIRLSSSTVYGRIVSLSTSTVSVDVDVRQTVQIPLSVRTEGTIPEGYLLHEVRSNPQTITVTGAATDIAEIASAEAVLQLDGHTESFSLATDYVLLNKDNEPIGERLNVQLGDGPSVSLSASIYEIRSVPILYEDSLVGTLAPDHILRTIEPVQTEVRIAAPAGILDALSGVTLSPINIDGRTETFTENASLIIPEGVVWCEVDSVQVTVLIDEALKEKSFAAVPVVVRNAAPGTVVSSNVQGAYVTITAPVSKLEALSREDIVVYVDASNIHSGVHELTLQAEILPLEKYSYSIDPATTLVTVTPSAER